MSKHANISDEAVEAVAEVVQQAHPFQSLSACRAEARAALEVAAPFIAAEAWDEGLKRGAVGAYTHPEEYATNPYRSLACDGSTNCASPGHIEGCFSTNPDYRSQE